MSKKTLILSQKQLDEICGGNSAYLDGLASAPDMAPNFASEITADGAVDDGYADPVTTDDYAHSMTNDWRGNAKLHGMGPITVREMTVKEWKDAYMNEEKEHGNDRLKNVQFGAANGQKGKSYDATKMALSRLHAAEKESMTGGTPEIKQKALNTVAKMKQNWNSIDLADKQYTAAKTADKTIQANKMPGTKRDTNNIMKPSNGVFLNQ